MLVFRILHVKHEQMIVAVENDWHQDNVSILVAKRDIVHHVYSLVVGEL